MKSIEAIKVFFERKDKISPDGGRKVENSEITHFAKNNPPGSTRELAELCAKELGETLDTPN